jgi:hypothetical protein
MNDSKLFDVNYLHHAMMTPAPIETRPPKLPLLHAGQKIYYLNANNYALC